MAYKTEEEARYRAWLDQKHKADQAGALNELGKIIGEDGSPPGEIRGSLLPLGEPRAGSSALGESGKLPPELQRQIDHELLSGLIYDLKKDPEKLRANYRKAVADQDGFEAEKQKHLAEESQRNKERNLAVAKKFKVMFLGERGGFLPTTVSCPDCGQPINLSERFEKKLPDMVTNQSMSPEDLLKGLQTGSESIIFSARCNNPISVRVGGVHHRVACPSNVLYRVLITK